MWTKILANYFNMKRKQVGKSNNSETSGAFEKLVKQKLESRKKRDAKKAELVRRMESQVRRSKLVDKRLGEHNPHISSEQKMLMRFTRERMKTRKAKKFDLDDDDDFVGLTHLGKSVDEIDDFKEPIEHSDNSESEGENSKSLAYVVDLNEELVGKLNFGGGEEEGMQKKKTRKEVFDEIIVKSKLIKAEKAKERMENKELADKINAQFSTILPMLKKYVHV
eukprot:TRINITY_DN13549_c0_g1_i4.p1 TRINITY_DN13549_c0_g1~~TRINITY_DN13549_c0_g1_i4.p1  ORF type:complete len:222 (-),score=63.67 TRINITY_DN13549_c0_g1_i4:176-841(-)